MRAADLRYGAREANIIDEWWWVVSFGTVFSDFDVGEWASPGQMTVNLIVTHNECDANVTVIGIASVPVDVTVNVT